MKKKISYLILLCIMLLPITTVMADGFSSNEVTSACGFEYMPSKLPGFTSGLVNLVKLLVPIILIIMGMVDFTRAMMSSDEKKMKDSQHRFITRLIAAVVIFLVIAVVQFVFKKIVTTTSYKNGFVNCMDCILNGDMTACGAGTTDLRKHCTDYDYKVCNSKIDDYGNECMVDNSEPTNLKCKVKGNSCEDYTADNCPPTTKSGTYHCKPINGLCKPVINCESYAVNQCQSLHGDVCTWNGNKCISKY